MIGKGSGVLPPCSHYQGWFTCTVALPPVLCGKCHVSSSVTKIVRHVKNQHAYSK